MPLFKSKDGRDIAFQYNPETKEVEVYEVELKKQTVITPSLVSEIYEYANKLNYPLSDDGKNFL
ncbi:MAG: hypothetical protein LBG72_05520 [Spirochaetaceae bacterium]|jgi:hypothetical protein|nr:hypothetical protein [Spirochaetaceae bacterium]